MLSRTLHTVFCLFVVVSATLARSTLETRKQKLMVEHARNSHVRHMAVDKLGDLKPAFLLHGVPIGFQFPMQSVGGPFHWESCGPAGQLVDIRNLTIKPSPLSFPGPISFGFDIIFHDTITPDTKVAADLKLQVNTRGTWIDIPCIGGIGSCKYDDLCSLMQHIQCPADLVNKGIPCSCPFNKGEYKLESYSVEVDASVFLTGDYKAQAVLSMPGKGQIACYKIAFTVE